MKKLISFKELAVNERYFTFSLKGSTVIEMAVIQESRA